MVLEGKKDRLIREMEKEMEEASKALLFEKAARLRDDIAALQGLGQRGDVERDVQPEVFPIDPKKGLAGLRKVLGLPHTPRTIEGVDIAHLGGSDTVASLVSFIDGLPFKPGYRRYRIKSVHGIDDFASIREVVTRRFRNAGSHRRGDEERVFPDILLIDGGKGQLQAALDAFAVLGVEPPCLISLAKREEEIYRPGEAEPLRLSRHAAALRLLQYVRDEAHRFAQHYHHILRRKKLEE
jgi:excinuclease ABC subunit C